MRVANRRRGLLDANIEQALIGDLEVLTLDTKEDHVTSPDRDPLSYQEAMASPDSEKWKVATFEEWDAILRNGTFQSFVEMETAPCSDQRQHMSLDPTPLSAPADVKTIRSKWVYKKKINPDGSTRYKVRLVIRGFEQIAGTDFGETYAPVSKLSTFRLLLSIAAKFGWKVDHMDVATAFLNPKIDRETVFMSLPAGMEWVDPWLHACGVDVVRLRKALYGLRQAPKLWFDAINAFLLALGFKASQADPNLYVKGSVILLLYVDDILIIETREETQEAEKVKEHLCAQYKMTSLGTARRFLGIQIACSDEGISLGQEDYINAILRRFGMEEAHSMQSPMDPNVHLDNTDCEDKPADKDQYLAIIGSLMYAALATRPDISFCVTSLSRYNQSPLTMHLTAAKRVLRYLKHTKHYRLHYSRDWTKSLAGFTDSDWAGRIATRKSIGGCVFFGYHGTGTTKSGPIHWQVKTQSVVALSTLEAEYIACSDATREALWLRRVEMDIIKAVDPLATLRTVPIGADNKGAIKLIHSGVAKQKTKHIDIKYQHSHDEESKGNVSFHYVHTSDNPAYLLTKPLPAPKHQFLTDLIGLR